MQSNKTHQPAASFEAHWFNELNNLRKNIDASEYKHIVLGLIFLKYAGDLFDIFYAKLMDEADCIILDNDPKIKDKFKQNRILWLPNQARWSWLHRYAKLPSIGHEVDEAMAAIEQANSWFVGALPQVYSNVTRDQVALDELIDRVSHIGLKGLDNTDTLGRVYEYCLGGFARAERKNGGQFYTPKSIVELLVKIVSPDKGSIYDPCCGSGDRLVMAAEFVKMHHGGVGDVAIYGQERHQDAYRQARMNLMFKGICGAAVKWNNAGALVDDAYLDLKADFVVAAPPFDNSDWGGKSRSKDQRWPYGAPPKDNANFAWLQHGICHLKPGGVAGFVLPTSSLSSQAVNEGVIRQNIVVAGLVDCIVRLPTRLLSHIHIPVALWFLSKKTDSVKHSSGGRGEILFIDAQRLGESETRHYPQLTDDEIARVASIYYHWRDQRKLYINIAGFCASVAVDKVAALNYVLDPSCYVGGQAGQPADVDFGSRLHTLKSEFEEQLAEEVKLNQRILDSLAHISLENE